jgi:hypothetical protein
MARHLCTRCGAVVDAPDPAPGEERHGACPECGLGFVSKGVVVARRADAAAPEDPARRARRAALDRARRDDALRALADRSFPLYGLDAAWTGRRWVGGWGRSGVQHPDRVRSVTLAHGDPWDPEAPVVRVESRTAEEPVERIFAAQELAATLFHETGEHTGAHRAPFGPDDPDSWWDPVELGVDRVPTPFRLLRSGAHWVALGRGDGCLITVAARHVEPDAVRLVTIDDPVAYLDDDAQPR